MIVTERKKAKTNTERDKPALVLRGQGVYTNAESVILSELDKDDKQVISKVKKLRLRPDWLFTTILLLCLLGLLLICWFVCLRFLLDLMLEIEIPFVLLYDSYILQKNYSRRTIF